MEGKGAVVFLPREDGRFNWMLEELMFAPPAVWMAETPTLSTHRLRRGLLGYLILFAPHAFVPQRQ